LEALEDRWLPATFTVVNSADAGPGSLRQAILDANADAGADLIAFNIPGAGVHTIAVGSTTGAALPEITDPVTVDGYSQPGTSPNTLAVGDDAVLLVALDGTSLGPGYSGLHITAGNSTVQGLMIDNFHYAAPAYVGYGILLENNGGCVIRGNWLGLLGTGGLPWQSNDGGNVTIDKGSSGNLIGGTTPQARNVLSGSGEGVYIPSGKANLIQNNYIGTDPKGTGAVGNFDGVVVTDGNTVGGSDPGAGNLISGNVREGIGGSPSVVQGNLVGTDALGTSVLSNGSFGLDINGANALIGGPTPGAGNVITGYSGYAVLIGASGITLQGNRIGVDRTGTFPVGAPQYGVIVYGPNNTIGGTTTEARNIIANANIANVYLANINDIITTGCIVEGNFIGSNAAGTAPLGYNGVGVLIDQGASNNTVGGSSDGSGNLIAGNTNGVQISALSNGNVVARNLIGISADGTPLGNSGDGVHLDSGAHDNQIGDAPTSTVFALGNTIAYNLGAGVAVRDPTTINNSILGNNIFGNGGKDIDVAGSGVPLAAPALLKAEFDLASSTMSGTLAAQPGITYKIEFYATAVQQVRVVAKESVTADGTGKAEFSFSSPPPSPGETLKFTATDMAGNTSEYSNDVTPLQPAQLHIDGVGRLTYTAAAGAANQLTISLAGSVYTFEDLGELIFVVNADPAVTTITGNGTHRVTCGPGIQSITVDLGDQQDTVNVQSIGVPTTIDDTGGGDDTVNVGMSPLFGLGSTVQGITAPLTVHNAASHTILNVNDTASAEPKTVLVTAIGLGSLAPASIFYDAGALAGLNVYGGSGGNRFQVFDTPGNALAPRTVLNLGGALDTVGVGATTGPLTIAGGPGPTVVLGTGNLQNIRGDVTILSPFAAVTVDDGSDPDHRSPVLSALDITELAPARISYPPTLLGPLGSLDVKGGSGGDTFKVTGTPNFAGAGVTTLEMGTGRPTVNVLATSGPLTLVTATSDVFNTINIGTSGLLKDIAGKVVIYNFGGTTVLDIDDSADTNPAIRTDPGLPGSSFPVEINVNQLGLGVATISVAHASIGQTDVTLHGGSGGNNFEYNGSREAPGHLGRTMIYSGVGNDTVTVMGAPGSVNVEGQKGADIVSLGDEQVGLDNFVGGVSVSSTSGTTALIINDNDDHGNDTFPTTLDSSSLSSFYFQAPITWSGRMTSLTLRVNPDGFNTHPILVQNTPECLSFILEGLSIDEGGTGSGRVMVLGTSGSLTTDFPQIDIGDGTVDNVHGPITALPAAPDDVGNRGLLSIRDFMDRNSKAVVVNNTSVTGLGPIISFPPGNFRTLSIECGSGSDDLTVASGLLAIPLVFMGGLGSNTLRGSNVNNTWQITGANSGSLNGAVSFESVQNLVGGTARDNFHFQSAGIVAGSLDGGPGAVNGLDYSEYDGDLKVNLLLHVATGAAAVANIANVTGGMRHSVIVGDTNANVLIGGIGRNILIGGAGADQLRGGGGDNILIGGTTSYDANLPALLLIMQEFLQTYDPTNAANDFNLRVNHIRDGEGGLAGTGIYLNKRTGAHAATVFADGFADVLAPGGSLNWYFVDATDSAILNQDSTQKKNDRITQV
jgi:hypothetical protein